MADGLQLIGGADDQCFRFVWIELESVLQVPLPDVSGTLGKNGQSVGCVVAVLGKTYMQLGVVSILVMLDAVACNNISHWATVYRKQQGTRPLGDAHIEPNGW